MIRWIQTATIAVVLACVIGALSHISASESGHGTKVYTQHGGDTLTIESGGTLNSESGSTATLAGTNTLSGTTTISGALTVSGTIAQTGALTATGGITVPSSATASISSGGTLTAASGSTTNLSGTTNVSGTMTVQQGGAIVFVDGAKIVLPTVTKSTTYTTTAAESGTTYIFTAADCTLQLPATSAGLKYRVIAGVVGSGGVTVSPVAADKIMGNGFTAADNKDVINEPATDRVGDTLEIVGDGIDGWYITSHEGTWIRE